MPRPTCDTAIGMAFVAGIVALAPPATAAPQILALIATDRPVALHCAGPACSAILPTLCLQPERRAPQPGREYRLAEGQSLSLLGNGQRRKITQGYRLIARRTHVAVEVRLPRAMTAGIESPAIAIGRNLSVLPVPRLDDETSLGEVEIAYATGARRAIADRLVDRERLRMPAVRMTNRLVNQHATGARADERWSEILADAKARSVAEAAIAHARFTYDLCKFKVANRLAPSLGACLGGINDDAMAYLNSALEPALKTGS